jgi:hypothetical protein
MGSETNLQVITLEGHLNTDISGSRKMSVSSTSQGTICFVIFYFALTVLFTPRHLLAVDLAGYVFGPGRNPISGVKVTMLDGNSPGGVTVQALPQVIRWTFLTAFANL